MYVSNIGINYASKFIPQLLKELERMHSKWLEKGQVEMVDGASYLLFQVMCKILFGEDIEDKIESSQITDWEDGYKIRKLGIYEALQLTSKGCLNAHQQPLNMFFPKAMVLHWGKINRTNFDNVKENT